jgi:hypothetical protein
MMEIEVLYFEGCPNHDALLAHVRQLLRQARVSEEISLQRVESVEAAERERFLGSPTLRIDGRDVEPGAERRTDYGMKCRLFATPDGLRGMPDDAWVLDAIRASR